MVNESIQPCALWAERLAMRKEDLLPEDLVSLTEHLDSCPACQQTAADYSELNTLLDDLPIPDLPEGLPPRLLAHWKQEDSIKRAARQRKWSSELIIGKAVGHSVTGAALGTAVGAVSGIFAVRLGVALGNLLTGDPASTILGDGEIQQTQGSVDQQAPTSITSHKFES